MGHLRNSTVAPPTASRYGISRTPGRSADVGAFITGKKRAALHPGVLDASPPAPLAVPLALIAIGGTTYGATVIDPVASKPGAYVERANGTVARPRGANIIVTRLHIHREGHLVSRIGWLRAAVLGANDSIVLTTSLTSFGPSMRKKASATSKIAHAAIAMARAKAANTKGPV